MTYTPDCGRSHILPPQHFLPAFSDIIEHLPRVQQVILPLLSFDIIGHCLPSLPWQQSPPFAQQEAAFPQHAVFASALPPLQQAQDFAWSVDGAGEVGVVLWAINARAIRIVLHTMRAFDFMVSSENSVCEQRSASTMVMTAANCRRHHGRYSEEL
jgi:hypothetical protein